MVTVSRLRPFILIFGGLCLVLALAFGLGGHEVAARYLNNVVGAKEGRVAYLDSHGEIRYATNSL